MDKIAANNHFVVLRKEIKKAKAMVCGNLIRKINKHKQEKENLNDEVQREKIENKINYVLNDIKIVKKLDSYMIAKQATLRPKVEIWHKVIGDSKATVEDRITGRIIVKNNIQKQVEKFRNDHKECDEWLNEYIEYREKKRELKETSCPAKRKLKKGGSGDRNERIKGRNKAPTSNRSVRKDTDKNRPHEKRKSIDRNHDEKRSLKKICDASSEGLHPSWEVKRKEKELLKAALAGELKQPQQIKFNENE